MKSRSEVAAEAAAQREKILTTGRPPVDLQVAPLEIILMVIAEKFGVPVAAVSDDWPLGHDATAIVADACAKFPGQAFRVREGMTVCDLKDQIAV